MAKQPFRLDELLYRQIPRSWLDDALGVTQQAFSPKSSEGYKLSTRREHIGAQSAFEEHIADGCKSAGTWGVTVAECVDAETQPEDDGGADGLRDGHVSVDFSGLDRPGRRAAAILLAEAANDRGCLFAPSGDA